MLNTMKFDDYLAVINYDPDIDMFRGEFVLLNGGADFYAKDIAGLRKEGEKSLKVYLDMCQEEGIEPKKSFSGRFNLRISSELHAQLSARAATENMSLNNWIERQLDQVVHNE
ncbi:type II toxin-antitoxin system HicB family antitoxin [Marinicella gelatinilytica]|uniref:type II toxin-antitoxin system HicB family antitoxin n=1 Tax=Marinicella gelatinilytica TaxID=2996017 RepID=UPI002260CCAF|nr:type II toxin-antitoxin system HicB family antitoxin [Marinicella gelatinilytica]MCX7544141.1 type II toxin-antitoxin system HicB family antitoxin [Marinicella gelatinilytica]